ncbi:3864_t:CDS:2 [Gigaspora margarita]|uniref:3864_t:CDS:1 n=1 Tax=Gigaspora margarita TaxID=4874 RepID=A0ABN7UFL3_GIGMA|nr:3864_t:CDS:2 [Gigaspora margarita]
MTRHHASHFITDAFISLDGKEFISDCLRLRKRPLYLSEVKNEHPETVNSA